MNKYHVTISYVDWSDFRAVVQADSEQEAFVKADRESPYPNGSLYLSKFSEAKLVSERNTEIRAHHKEEADSGNI